MKISALLYIADDISLEDLSFAGHFLPNLLGKRLETLNSLNEVFVSTPFGFKETITTNYKLFPREGGNEMAFWKKLFSSTESDHIVKIYADSPFLDSEIIEEMLRDHLEYMPEFTYSENLPAGYSCEILARELMESLPDTEEKTPPLSEMIRSNFHQFDIEIFYKDPDIRDKRIAFRSSLPRDKRIMEALHHLNGGFPSYSEIKDLLHKNPEILYIGPSYLELEITGQCELDCLFCYRSKLRETRGDMDPELFQRILEGMRDFSLPYALCFSGSGEPLQHNQFYSLLERALKESLISTLILETNAIHADSNFRTFVETNPDSRFKIIININGMDRQSYQNLHGRDCFEKVQNNILSLNEVLADSGRLYLQIMKINETEPFLDAYYDLWEKNRIPIILQKQNTFLSLIEDRRYSDLSPLERIPCWHLQRQLHILSDGRACYCKQDIDSAFFSGNLYQESLRDIWERRKEAFIRNYKGDLASAPDCRSCDEWYTFNL